MTGVIHWLLALASPAVALYRRGLPLMRRAQAALQQLVSAADAFQQRRTWLAFPLAVVRKLSNDGGGSLAGLIAYYGFLGVFPLLLVFAAVLGFVLAGDPALRMQVLTAAEASFPSLRHLLSNTISGSDVALGVGLAAALWAGLGVTRATERAMNAIWDIPLAERPSLWWSRLRGLAMLCILGSTFLVSTALAALRGTGGRLALVTDVLAVGGSLLLNVVLYLLAFQVLTNRHLAWRQILPGALVGAVGWTVLQSLGNFYVRHEVAHAGRLYGSLAAVVGLLAWIYLGAQLTLYAAEVNVVLAERLWPRSLAGRARTEADQRALIRQAREAGRAAGEVITVTFGSQAAEAEAEPAQQARAAEQAPLPSSAGPVSQCAAARAGPSSARAGPSSARAGPSSARAQATHAAVSRLALHLDELDRCRQQADECEDPAVRDGLLQDLATQASAAAAALADLARHEADLRDGLRRHLG